MKYKSSYKMNNPNPIHYMSILSPTTQLITLTLLSNSLIHSLQLIIWTEVLSSIVPGVAYTGQTVSDTPLISGFPSASTLQF